MKYPFFWLCLLLSLAVQAADPNPSDATKSEQALRFSDDIKNFQAKDVANPPPPHGLLFSGASSFRRWTNLSEVFKGYPVINRGFGGSKTTEVLAYMDRITLPYHPRVVAFHCGSNDINAGDKAELVVERVRTYLHRLLQENPHCALVLLSTTHAPSRRKTWDEMVKLDRGFQEIARTEKSVTYVDINPALNLPDGEPRPGVYASDNLHPNEAGYVAISALLLPVIAAAWQQTAPAFTK